MVASSEHRLHIPAVLLGGPPHSGKTILATRLSQALRQNGIMHYVLRASPDGEGIWHEQIEPQLASTLRKRAQASWTPHFAEALAQDIIRRQVPLIVDAGGRVTAEIEQIAMPCTHAILIAGSFADLTAWRDLALRYNLQILAELQSSTSDAQSIIADSPILRGVISGLDPNLSSDGDCFEMLYTRTALCMTIPRFILARHHIAQLDNDLIIDIEEPIYPLPDHTRSSWQPHELRSLLESVPAATALGVYGAGPVWVFAALAAHAQPASCAMFDPRSGWVLPPVLVPEVTVHGAQLEWTVHIQDERIAHIYFTIAGGYISYDAALDLPIPTINATFGVIINGRLPAWLFAAITRSYIHQPFVAVYQPQLAGAIVVHSRDNQWPIGLIIDVHAIM